MFVPGVFAFRRFTVKENDNIGIVTTFSWNNIAMYVRKFISKEKSEMARLTFVLFILMHNSVNFLNETTN